MNKSRKSILSLLLAIALLLPMVPAARAAGTAEATGVMLDPESGIEIYYRASGSKSVTVTATAQPKDYNGHITWSLDKGAPLSADKKLNKALAYDKTNRAIKLTAKEVSKATAVTLTVTLDGADGAAVSKSVSLLVKPDEIKTFQVSPASLELEAGDSSSLSVKSLYESDGSAAPVSYASSNPKVAQVSSSGVVTGVGVGQATITVTSVNKSATVPVTVSKPTADVKANAKLGADLSMLDLYETILLRFNTAYPAKTPKDITFSGTASSIGELRDAVGAVTDGTYAFSELRSMYFRPKAAGTYKCAYTATLEETSAIYTLTGTITITVAVPTANIRIPISSKGDYSFDRASLDPSGKTGAMLIREAIGTFGSIKFGAIQSDTNVGTLYATSAATAADRVVNGTYITANAVEALYFIPNRSGTYSIAFTAYSEYDGTGTVVCTGSIIIPVDAKSLDVTIDLDSTAAYTFGRPMRTNAESAYTLMVRTINDGVGRSAWGGVKFGTPSTASAAVGTLRQSSAYNRAIGSDVFVDYGAISELYFVPERTGVYTVGYSVYTDAKSTVPVATGTLTINVSTIPAGEADIIYTTSVNNTVSMNESDFLDFFQRKNGSRYYLACVVFNDFEGSETFSHGSERFVPYNSRDLYTRSYTGALPQYPYYLDQVTFTAPKASGLTKVKFTCYGSTSSSAMTTTTSGVLYIYYTSGDVPAVRYDAYASSTVDLREADFVSVYQAAMNSSAAAPAFSIRLLSVPSHGTLYRNYNRNNRSALSQSSISAYTFTVNGSAASDSVSQLTYIPDRNATGSDSVTYLAFNASGEPLFIGTVEFKLGADNTVYTTMDGLGFQPSAFYTAGDADPVVYVTFETPESGRMYALAGSRYVQTDKNTRFYISSPSDGVYPLTAALYAPRCGQSASVTLSIIAHRRSGATYTYTTIVNVMKKNGSTVFSDVSGVDGWAGDSVDFANRLGLVGGTQKDPPLFSPTMTMRRCDLVLILYRLAGSPVVTGSMPYTDVTPDKYYYASALWAYQNGIMRGVASGSVYNPEGALLRQDFAQILFNYTASQGISTANNGSLQGYRDAAQVSPETTEGVRWAVANGYFTSASATAMTIEPQRSATRAEIVTLLHRYLTY